jgi:hypothetical protein
LRKILGQGLGAAGAIDEHLSLVSSRTTEEIQDHERDHHCNEYETIKDLPSGESLFSAQKNNCTMFRFLKVPVIGVLVRDWLRTNPQHGWGQL